MITVSTKRTNHIACFLAFDVYGGAFEVDLANMVVSLLPHGEARLSQVAHRLGMSPRTLARRLASEGLTFSGVVSRLRTELATRYLSEQHLAISQVAWLLGYQKVSGFTHAFKRWTGKTPKEARALKNPVRRKEASRGARKGASVS